MISFVKISAIAVLIVVAISFSGCCCCYGLDGFTSKYQKSADDIQFPAQITAGGKTLTLTKSEYLPSADACKNASIKALADEGLAGKISSGDIGTAISMAGGTSGKTFEYSDASGKKRVGGFVGKGDSPGKLSASFITGKQLLSGSSELKYSDSFKAGDEAYVYTTNELREPASIALCRYSNMFVYACSYDSSASAEDAVTSAIAAIDAANK
jgi:hypothetical protein